MGVAGALINGVWSISCINKKKATYCDPLNSKTYFFLPDNVFTPITILLPNILPKPNNTTPTDAINMIPPNVLMINYLIP